MFFNKIKSNASGIMLYGITPPKVGTDPEKVKNYADKTVERISALDLDALVVYDVQDESERIADERPFPYLKAHDPLEFSEEYLKNLSLEKIIYRPAGKFRSEELTQWMQELNKSNYHPVFVGLPSPDTIPLTSLNEAYEIWKEHGPNTVIGAVAIPERHAMLRDEDLRIMSKANQGVSYFITQCVFHIGYSKDMIDALLGYCKTNNLQIPTIIFTLTSCGSDKTLSFLEWLGIYIPNEIKINLLESTDILNDSTNLCIDMARELTEYCLERGVPFGFNVESVAIRKSEIEASIRLVNDICTILYEKGVRAKP